MVLGLEPRTLYLVDKSSSIKPYPQGSLLMRLAFKGKSQENENWELQSSLKLALMWLVVVNLGMPIRVWVSNFLIWWTSSLDAFFPSLLAGILTNNRDNPAFWDFLPNTLRYVIGQGVHCLLCKNRFYCHFSSWVDEYSFACVRMMCGVVKVLLKVLLTWLSIFLAQPLEILVS